VSEPETFAFAKLSSRGFALAFCMGLCVVAAALDVQNADLTERHDARTVSRRPILMGLMRGPGLIGRSMLSSSQPVQPSAFDEESVMTQAQLLGRWDDFISEASRRFHVPKAWIRAVMARESGGRTMLGVGRPIVSRAGAMGLMQVLPETYQEMAQAHKLGNNPFDAHDNILAGTAYLRWLHHKYGYPAMFAAYNAGPGRLEDHLQRGAQLPAETRAYVGGIAKALNLAGPSSLDLVKFTRPDGAVVKIDPREVTAIRAVLPGEFDPVAQSVLTLGRHKQQAIRETVAAASAAIRAASG
jgi:hypothetical protein